MATESRNPKARWHTEKVLRSVQLLPLPCPFRAVQVGINSHGAPGSDGYGEVWQYPLDVLGVVASLEDHWSKRMAGDHYPSLPGPDPRAIRRDGFGYEGSRDADFDLLVWSDEYSCPVRIGEESCGNTRVVVLPWPDDSADRQGRWAALVRAAEHELRKLVPKAAAVESLKG